MNMKKIAALGLVSLTLGITACSTTTTTQRQITHIQQHDTDKALVLYGEVESTVEQNLISGTKFSQQVKEQRAAVCAKDGEVLNCSSMGIQIDGKPMKIVETK